LLAQNVVLVHFFSNFCDSSLGQICVGHTEGKGLGYSKGYTSLDLFLSKPLCQTTFLPFVDLRGHVFNDGKYASNIGLGLRWDNTCCEQIWGIYCFYDSLKTGHRPYHQISLGLEAISENWEVHLNGYLPVGRTKTSLYAFVYKSLSASGFLLKGREQFAMRGVDYEVGYRCSNLYVGLGPYCYWGRSAATENVFRHAHKHTIGGRLRASVSFLRYFQLDAVTTYDPRFKWGGQFTLAVCLPFDLFRCREDVCHFNERLYQPVVRNEIMVIDRINRYSTNPEILNPQFNP